MPHQLGVHRALPQRPGKMSCRDRSSTLGVLDQLLRKVDMAGNSCGAISQRTASSSHTCASAKHGRRKSLDIMLQSGKPGNVQRLAEDLNSRPKLKGLRPLLCFLDFFFSLRRKLEPAFLRLFIEAQTLKDRRPHLDGAALALVGPLGEFDFRHHLRTNVVHGAGALYFAKEWTLCNLQLLQSLPHLRVRLPGKSAAGMTNVDELVLIVIKAEHQGAEIFARASRVSVASNDAFLPFGDLDLQPFTTPLGLVAAPPLLGYDPFQSAFGCGMEEVDASPYVVIGKTQAIARLNN